MSIPYDEPAPTLNEVWRLFRETDRIIKENNQAAERRLQELDRKFQETDRIIKENNQAAEKRSQELDRSIREGDRLLRKQIGDLGGRLGDFVEGMIKPSAVRLFQERGIDVHKVSRNVEVNDTQLNLAIEIDLLVVNGDSCILIEVKSNLSLDDVNEHLERMEKFKPLFPEYADKKALGAVAGMVISDNVAKYAYRKGFFVIAQKGDTAIILNDEKFQPTAW
ncbi:MAG: hypothetical protein R3E08_09295 [Thiotrichaceae bacterium]